MHCTICFICKILHDMVMLLFPCIIDYLLSIACSMYCTSVKFVITNAAEVLVPLMDTMYGPKRKYCFFLDRATYKLLLPSY